MLGCFSGFHGFLQGLLLIQWEWQALQVPQPPCRGWNLLTMPLLCWAFQHRSPLYSAAGLPGPASLPASCYCLIAVIALGSGTAVISGDRALGLKNICGYRREQRRKIFSPLLTMFSLQVSEGVLKHAF